MDEKITWNIIDKYFYDNPNILVEHHIESYNDFYKTGIYKIFKENNPIYIQSNYDETIDDYRNQCLIYLGGKDGSKIYFGKPIVYDDDDNIHYMYPNEARLRNMTYGMTIHYDVDVEFIDVLGEDEPPSLIVDNTVDVEKETKEDYVEKKKFVDFKTLVLEDETAEVKGGMAPKGKTKRKKRNVKPFDMTTAMTSDLRKALEESLIGSNKQLRKHTYEKVYLGKFPIMVQSDFCLLNNMPPELRFNMGECKHDKGGYFIIQGKEKAIISQEKFADNVLYVKKRAIETEEGVHQDIFSVEIKSVSENVSKPVRRLFVTIAEDGDMGLAKYTNKNILVSIPNVRKPVPLFIVFRALGIISDKSIIEMCLLDIEKYEYLLDLFIPSVHDAGGIISQKLAIEYISFLVKGNKDEHVLEILSDYFLPHIGETNYYEKAHFLGHMVFRLISVYNGMENPTDRDDFQHKRIETTGSLISELFREYFAMQQKYIRQQYDKTLTLNKNQFSHDLYSLFEMNKNYIFSNKIVEDGFRKAYKGNWGAKEHTKRIGAVQDMNRLSFNGYLAHMRKTNLPFDSSNKNPEPRHLHGSQWGFIDPIDTPDGGNIGLHKHLAVGTHITVGSIPREHVINWLREKITLRLLNESSPKTLSNMTKVFVNGFWAGCIYNPFDCVEKIKAYRRNGLISLYLSVSFNIRLNSIFIFCDSGRLCRPIYYRDVDGKLSIEREKYKEKLLKGQFSWEDLVTGFNEKKNAAYYKNHNLIFEPGELYEGLHEETNINKIEKMKAHKALIDYIDSNESSTALICMDYGDFDKKKYTHMEIDKSLIFGTLANQIPFPETNQAPRNMFSCGQTKQATSIYSTNYVNRMDKSAIVLNTGQIPLVKTRYMKYFNNEEMPYGENLVVAIMCYGGYNMEDSLLINEGSIKRGMFTTTYYNTYETHEEIEESGDNKTETLFGNVDKKFEVIGKKEDYDYNLLDDHGLINEGTQVTEKSILIGKYTRSQDAPNRDQSVSPKKGQLGVVDKSFMTNDDEGKRIAKVRIRDMRVPNLGDKMGSRVGQKGTVGLVIPESDMPFTKNGLKPDLIVNPHAIPSRMTVGQLIESLTAKGCVMMGGFGDCTAFINNGSKAEVFGKLLTQNGYHSSGNDIMYNGMTGEQIEMEIFMGPTYYMRLKHMVKDKINYRARGPNATLTRQPVGGRANDGGLRIGEMERDTIISHGAVNFLTESMMERGDKYEMAVCNNSGMIAIYNPDKNLFLSPILDGPIVFDGSVEGNNLHIENISEFGRNFSVVRVPYSMKLLMQELMAINVQMRIITESNIDQIENMCFSDNIKKLANIDDFGKLIGVVNRKLNDKDVKDKGLMLEKKETPETISPDYPDDSFEFKPDEESETNKQSLNSDESPPYSVIDQMRPKTKAYDMFKESMLQKNPILDEESIIDSYRDFTKTGNIPKTMTEPTIKDEQRVVGGSVCLRDHPKDESNKWTIKNISPEFYTIQRSNKRDLDIENDIKVVEKNAVYSPEEMVMSMALPESHIQEQHQQPYFPEMGKSMVFAPSITVLGNNNDHVTLPEHTMTPQQTQPSYPEYSSETLDQPIEPIVVKTNESPKEESNGKLDKIDFSKELIIKKI